MLRESEPVTAPSPQPTAKPRRRWFQFSLRTLLIGTAVVAVFCAIGLRWIVPAQRQRAAVKMVKDAKGFVQYADPEAHEWRIVSTLRDWLPRDFFDPVVAASFEFRGVPRAVPLPLTDADMNALVGFPQLQELNLGSTKITDAGLAHVQVLSQLRSLDIDGTMTSDLGLAHLHDLADLRHLSLASTKISDAGLSELEQLCELESLDLTATRITDGGLDRLTRHPRLQSLSLSFLSITDEGLSHVGQLTQLRRLELAGTAITDAGLVHLHGLSRLESLNLELTKVTKAGVAAFQKAVSDVEIVALAAE